MTDPAAAAVAVGYSQPFSQSRAYTLRKELMFYIEKKLAPVMERTEITRAQVMNELAAIAMSKLTDYFEVVDSPDGSSHLSPKENLKVLPDHIQSAIKKIDFDTIVMPDGTTRTFVSKLELHNKLGALQEIVEILRMKQGPTGNSKENKLLSNMPANKLAALREILEETAAIVADAENKERDRNAIPG